MSSKFRVRCCPSDTGLSIHAGNSKTFIFNFLFAKKYNADFLLRIEDTDQARKVDGCAENILRDLKWLGVAPTMGFGTDNKPAGVYTQMERLPIYQKYANELLKKGLAYKCYCSQEELDKKREEALANNPKNPFKYPGTCENIGDIPDKKYVIRLKTPKDGFTEIEDITFGKRSLPNKENYDFVIMRADGSPLFSFANSVDDGIIDNVTHIIRGSDHYKNLISQFFIYKALGLQIPVFCHLPLLRNKEGGKLSKRDGAVSITEFKELGFSPNAVINYLVKFGWGYGNQEIFSLDELISKFTLEACHNKDGKFDYVKFTSVNYEHLKSVSLTPDSEYARLLKPFIDAKNVGDWTEKQLIPYINVIRSRAKTFVEAANMLEPMLKSEIQAPTDLIEKNFSEEMRPKMQELRNVLADVAVWSEPEIKATIQNWLDAKQLLFKDIGAPLRTALLGQSNSPELFQVLNVLGKDKSVRRLNAILER